ncbi:MAG: DNA gyrase subunit A [Candidatus Promineofilum sp.]|nr:DNA gyrase subunit A [Promineifilum sp.]MBP9656722.1 DNA gyrase subunit A [Promineifilum sp.]
MEVGLIKQVNIDQEMRESYLSYAMSVIVSRALPDARDGLKPVQRRILYAMYDMGLRPDQPYRKSARVVGEVLGKYHPHGDQSVYEAMVRMAQDFSMRYMLVDGQGNFGSIDGDAAAAMRYTEARMSQMGFDLLEDIDKETVDFTPNFDDSLKEPSVLPATIPNLLINGSSGIAVGMATSIPPHNLSEVIAALVYMLDNWKNLDDISVSDLMRFILGPDFPTGGLIARRRGDEDETDAIASAYATGRGRIVVRARAHIEQMGRNKSRIIITEIPYQVNKTNLMGRIADLHRDGKIEGLTDLRDESDRRGLRIIIETTRTVDAEEVLADLFRLTPLQSTFSISLLALVNHEPRVLTLKQALRHYLEHRLEVVRRRSEYDLARALVRAHILEGLLKALDHLDEVIDLIRRSRSADTAKTNLIDRFKLTEIQAQAILDMQLRRLAGLERKKIQDEYKEKLALIKELERLLARPELMREQIKKELQEVSERFGDKRRTQIVDSVDGGVLTSAGLLPDEQGWIMIGEKGTIGRAAGSSLPAMARKPLEQPVALLRAGTRDTLYLVSASGRAVGLPVHRIPEAETIGNGALWSNLTSIGRSDLPTAAFVLSADGSREGYLFLTTLAGVVKRVRLEDLPGVTAEPFTVINVADDDALGWARITGGDQEVLLATSSGQAIRFREDTVRPMGLPASGVLGIKLDNDADGVISMDVVIPDGFVWSITDNGLAKATPIDDYPLQNRYGQGVINMRLPKDAAEVVASTMMAKGATLIVTTSGGVTKRVGLSDTTVGSRSVRPQSVMTLAAKSRVSGVVQPVTEVFSIKNESASEPRKKRSKSENAKVEFGEKR